MPGPPVADDVEAAQLDRAARARLRTLSKDNADRVAQHLVMAGRLIESDPELAYEHAQAAVRRAGRVDVVREAAALAAYATGRYAEALRELRTVRRLSGIDAHRAIEADCERGLGRPDRALTLVQEAPPGLSADDRAELAIVAAGARTDLDQPDAALATLERAESPDLTPAARERLDDARHTVLVALGREDPDERDASSAPSGTTSDAVLPPGSAPGPQEPGTTDDEPPAVDDGDVLEITDTLEQE